jgi:branched-chain amino acid transport system ATP-binding protein
VGNGPQTISVSNLEVRYGTVLAIKDVSFEVSDGSVLALLGSNGAGKSTIARACAGLVNPSRGEITLGGIDFTRASAHRTRRAGLVYLPEGRGLFPQLTVGENLKLTGLLEKDWRAVIERAIELFPALGSRLRQRAGSLSGGEQQMLSLARALAVHPKILIVDEASLGLSPKMVDLVFDSLERVKKQGTTMIIIDQYVDLVLALSDDCVILRRGEISWQGPASGASAILTSHYLGEEFHTDPVANDSDTVSGEVAN